MDGEFRRPGEETDGIEVDREVRTIAGRFQRIANGTGVASHVALFGGPVVAFVLSGPIAALAVIPAVYLIAGASLFRVGSEVDLVTDRPPAAVRSEFRRPNNPVTAIAVAAADEVEPIDVPGAVAAVLLRSTALEVFESEARLVVSELEASGSGDGATPPTDGPRVGDRRARAGGRRSADGGPFRIRLLKDDEVFSTVDVRVRDEGDRTGVAVEAETRPRLSALRLALALLEARYQERISEHYGYEERDSELHVRLRSGDRGSDRSR